MSASEISSELQKRKLQLKQAGVRFTSSELEKLKLQLNTLTLTRILPSNKTNKVNRHKLNNSRRPAAGSVVQVRNVSANNIPHREVNFVTKVMTSERDYMILEDNIVLQKGRTLMVMYSHDCYPEYKHLEDNTWYLPTLYMSPYVNEGKPQGWLPTPVLVDLVTPARLSVQPKSPSNPRDPRLLRIKPSTLTSRELEELKLQLNRIKKSHVVKPNKKRKIR